MSANHITASPAPGKNLLLAAVGGWTMPLGGRLLTAIKEDWCSETDF
jgi:hypothetical protein